MAGKMKLVRAATGVAAAMGILTLGIFPGFPLEQGRSQGTKAYRQLDTSRIVVDVQRSFSLADYPLVLKVTAPDSGEFADFGQSEYAVPDGKNGKPGHVGIPGKIGSAGNGFSRSSRLFGCPFAFRTVLRRRRSVAKAAQDNTCPCFRRGVGHRPDRRFLLGRGGHPCFRSAPRGRNHSARCHGRPRPFFHLHPARSAPFRRGCEGCLHPQGEGLFVLDAPGVSRVRAGKHPESFSHRFRSDGGGCASSPGSGHGFRLEIIFPGQIAGKKQ